MLTVRPIKYSGLTRLALLSSLLPGSFGALGGWIHCQSKLLEPNLEDLALRSSLSTEYFSLVNESIASAISIVSSPRD